MTDALGHDKSGAVSNPVLTPAAGHSAKTLKGDSSALPIDIPRDRQGKFEPQSFLSTRPA
jgi:putative transposase